MGSQHQPVISVTGKAVLPMTEVNIIDVEASGLHVDSYPIEIAVLVEGQVHSWLIKPSDQWQHWCVRAEALHGIARRELLSKGLDLTVVANELNTLMAKASGILYSDADRWDDDWINTLYTQAGIKPTFHILSIYDLLSNDQAYQFQKNIRGLAASDKYRRHRAGEDVRMIYEAYSIVVKD